MKEHQSPGQTTWDCKYHVVFTPNSRKRRIFGHYARSPGRDQQLVEGELFPLTINGDKPRFFIRLAFRPACGTEFIRHFCITGL